LRILRGDRQSLQISRATPLPRTAELGGIQFWRVCGTQQINKKTDIRRQRDLTTFSDPVSDLQRKRG
jgi:hypothetical protein